MISNLFQKKKKKDLKNNDFKSFPLSKAARMLSSFVLSSSFIITHKKVRKNRSQRRTHGYTINLVVKLMLKRK